jgi:hypothetical protein
MVKRNGQNLLRLVNQLLDLSKLEDRSFQLKLQHGDIVPFLRYVTESFQSYANGQNLSLRFLTNIEKLEMDFDPEQVQQVMTNLIGNAIKFTPSGGEIKVGVRDEGVGMRGGVGSSLIPRPSSLFIAVSDTGIGIPADELPHIFDRFYQVDGSTTRAGEGTGIGLAHTLELVKLMGGEIGVESELGKGTTFTVKLPVAHSPGTQPLIVSQPLTSRNFGTGSKGEPIQPTSAEFTYNSADLGSPFRGSGGNQEGNHPTIQQSNHPTIKQSNNPTIQPSNNPTIQPSNHPTIQQSNHPTTSSSSKTTPTWSST